jgi:3-hydroxyisobutyrate dehydrogenase-like beta-hydroxyacid dehydrogenase
LRVCPVTAIVGGQTRDAGTPEAFRDLILETLFGCRAYRLYSAKVVNGDFEPGFTMNLGLKNLGLAAAPARRSDDASLLHAGARADGQGRPAGHG